MRKKEKLGGKKLTKILRTGTQRILFIHTTDVSKGTELFAGKQVSGASPHKGIFTATECGKNVPLDAFASLR